MPVRLAACDPCRLSKLACDHSKPICTRCRDRDQGDACVYRNRPFKRKLKGSREIGLNALHSDSAAHTTIPTSYSYPNPGYLGHSSHATIFGQLPATTDTEESSPIYSDSGLPPKFNQSNVAQGAKLIEQCCRTFQITMCKNLVEAWIRMGANLALANLSTVQCAQATYETLKLPDAHVDDAATISRKLFTNSCSPLRTTSSLDDFIGSFCQAGVRWETLGLFFAAVSRATIDLASFDMLYETEDQRRSLRRLAMHYSDCFLDISVSLDSLNDVLLMLQYENFIVHSLVDGDQSYHSWRKLGDVVSSLFALGYHERVEAETTTPHYMQELRRAAFARGYSADKNVSIFLGRPPRIHKKHCRFSLPGSTAESVGHHASNGLQQPVRWTEHAPFDYTADTRWSALCAIYKEDIIELNRERNHDERDRIASSIKTKIEAHWLDLPPRYRLEIPLKDRECTPIERDFLISTRLNYLHVLFLLRLALVRHMTEQDSRLIRISANMLHLIAEAMVLKDRLVNSGTGLVWKVAYYGLPAAGIISLSLLNQNALADHRQISIVDSFQDLSVLVAEVESGALVHLEDPNYALLAGATRAIKSLLTRYMSGELNRFSLDISEAAVPAETITDQGEAQLDPWLSTNLQDFEIDFWLNLAEHPFLNTSEGEMREAS